MVNKPDDNIQEFNRWFHEECNANLFTRKRYLGFMLSSFLYLIIVIIFVSGSIEYAFSDFVRQHQYGFLLVAAVLGGITFYFGSFLDNALNRDITWKGNLGYSILGMVLAPFGVIVSIVSIPLLLILMSAVWTQKRCISAISRPSTKLSQLSYSFPQTTAHLADSVRSTRKAPSKEELSYSMENGGDIGIYIKNDKEEAIKIAEDELNGIIQKGEDAGEQAEQDIENKNFESAYQNWKKAEERFRLALSIAQESNSHGLKITSRLSTDVLEKKK